MLQAANDGTPVSTIALFAGVIGVVVGWLLGEISRTVRWWFQRTDSLKTAHKARVIDFLQCAESLSAHASSLAYARAARAGGYNPSNDQFMRVANTFNEESTRIDRIGLEIKVLGPSWSNDLATACVDLSRELNDRVNDVERAPSAATLQAVIDELDEMAKKRQELTDLAVEKYA